MHQDDEHGELWIFAYGSLMWRPGFAFAEAAPALLDGYHRDFCVYSLRYRGTAAMPGLVLGLDRGGTCKGVAYRVEGRDRAPALAYLRERELIYGVYREALLPVSLLRPRRAELMAITFVAERRHPSYAGGMALRVEACIMRRARGIAGTNIDYLVNTLEHLRELGIRERRLERLLTEIGAFSARGIALDGARARAIALSKAWASKHRGGDMGPRSTERHRFTYRKPRGG